MLEMTDLTVIFRTLKSHWHLHFYTPVFALSLFFFFKPEDHSADEETGS